MTRRARGVVDVVELETVSPEMRGEMTITIALHIDAGTAVVTR